MKITRLYENGFRAAAAGAVALVMVWCGNAFGGTNPPPAVTIEIDENCHGTFTQSGGSPTPLLCSILPDVLAGGHPTVTYTLDPVFPAGSLFATGTLNLVEGGDVASDQIRFESPGFGGATTLVFYSDNVDGVDAMADTGGIPSIFPGPGIDLLEVGPEGNNGLTYIPPIGLPGSSPSVALTYIIHSDSSASAPEPATLALLGLGLAGLGFSRRRKQ